MALPRGRIWEQCATRPNHQRTKETRRQGLHTLFVSTRGHYACVHGRLGGLKLADPTITTEAKGLTEAQSRPADLFTTCFPRAQRGSGRVCVPSSNAAAARVDAAQAAFDREISQYRIEVPDLRGQRILHRLLCGQQMVAHTQQSPEP